MQELDKHTSEWGGRVPCLVLFTKPPRPGRVKTRLTTLLTAAQAAELHLALVGDLGSRLARAARRGLFAWKVAWALDREEKLRAELGSWDPDGVLAEAQHERQHDGDLGQRLVTSLRAAAAEHPAVAAVGSDHPQLETSTVEQGFGLLQQGADVVIGPSVDGGYYFVGLRSELLQGNAGSSSTRRAEGIFENIPWSSSDVLACTLQRCEQLGLHVALLPEGRDVDLPQDLHDLARDLAAGAGPDCPRCRALLSSWDLPAQDRVPS